MPTVAIASPDTPLVSPAGGSRGRRRRLVTVLFLSLFPLAPAARGAPFELVATHPDAAAQSTAIGKTLSTLKPFNGKIYAGYGDYDPLNTGPIAVRAFEPATGRFTDPLLTRPQPPHGAETNAMLIFREIDGRLYAPHTDPWPDPPPVGERGGYTVGVPAGAAEAWTDHRVVPGIHLFDVATFDGADLWLVGSSGPNATAWRSRDGGATWQESIRVAPLSTTQNARFYGLHAYNGRLYTQASYFRDLHPRSKVFDGTSWSDGPTLAPPGTGGFIWHPETFAGYLVYQRDHAGLTPSVLCKFDGTRATSVALPAGWSRAFYDYTISDGVLYGLLNDGRVIRTTDLTTWTLVDRMTTGGPRSLAVLDDTLYVGAVNGRLYRYSVPIPEPAGPIATAMIAATAVARRCHRCGGWLRKEA